MFFSPCKNMIKQFNKGLAPFAQDEMCAPDEYCMPLQNVRGQATGTHSSQAKVLELQDEDVQSSASTLDNNDRDLGDWDSSDASGQSPSSLAPFESLMHEHVLGVRDNAIYVSKLISQGVSYAMKECVAPSAMYVANGATFENFAHVMNEYVTPSAKFGANCVTYAAAGINKGLETFIDPLAQDRSCSELNSALIVGASSAIKFATSGMSAFAQLGAFTVGSIVPAAKIAYKTLDITAKVTKMSSDAALYVGKGIAYGALEVKQYFFKEGSVQDVPSNSGDASSALEQTGDSFGADLLADEFLGMADSE